MSGGSRHRTALEATGARLGEMLQRALADRLARRAGEDRDDLRRADGVVPKGGAERVAGADGSRAERNAQAPAFGLAEDEGKSR